MALRRRTIERVLASAVFLLLGWTAGRMTGDGLAALLLVDDTTGAADAIVVAGAGLGAACQPNVSALRRSQLAAALWRDQRAPVIVFTGGTQRNRSCVVSEVMAGVATEAGVPADRILTEAKSTSTFENAVYAAPVLRAAGARRILLVTDALHMRRASRVFEAAGYTVERASVPLGATHQSASSVLATAMREGAALAAYRARGWMDGVVVAHEAETSIEQPRPQSASRPPAPIVILGASYALGWNIGTLAGSPVQNKGITGQQSFEMAERIERDVLAQSPRAVILWGFINDVFRAPRPEIDSALARTRASYLDMIAKARAAGVDVIIATEVTMADSSSWIDQLRAYVGRLLGRTGYSDYVNAHVRATNEWVRETATREQLLLLDFEHVLAQPDGRRRPEFAQEDGSHLSPAAYDALSRYANPIVERFFREGTVD
jgi:uncharacterized SAM-binding protein YcdF (DUF218 family)/lysophospholipase L1-like esterase